MDSQMYYATSNGSTLGRRTQSAVVKRNDCPVAEVTTDGLACLNVEKLALQGMHAVRGLAIRLRHCRRAILNAVACTQQIQRTTRRVRRGHHKLTSSQVQAHCWRGRRRRTWLATPAHLSRLCRRRFRAVSDTQCLRWGRSERWRCLWATLN